MFPYWILFGTFAIAALSARTYQRKQPAFLLLFAGFAMMLMIGLRYHVGVDWTNYVEVWNYAARSSWSEFLAGYGGDPAFYTLTWLLRQAGLQFWTLNLICAAIFTWGLLRFSRLQPNPWLAIAIAVPYLIIVVAMSGTRQATAIGFLFVALEAFVEKRIVRFFACLACAAAFHASAIVVLGIVGPNFAKNRSQSALLFIFAIGIAYFALRSTFSEYSAQYLGKFTLQSSGTIYRIAMAIVAATLYFVFKNKFEFTETELKLWRNFSIFVFCSIPLMGILPSTTVVDRLMLYSYPLQIAILSHIPYAISRDHRNRIVVIFIILAYLASIMTVFFTYGVNRYPYIPFRIYPFAEGS